MTKGEEATRATAVERHWDYLTWRGNKNNGGVV